MNYANSITDSIQSVARVYVKGFDIPIRVINSKLFGYIVWMQDITLKVDSLKDGLRLISVIDRCTVVMYDCSPSKFSFLIGEHHEIDDLYENNKQKGVK